MISLKSYNISRCTFRASKKTPLRRLVIVRTSREERHAATEQAREKLEHAIIKAQEICDKGTHKDCMVAWSEVDEINHGLHMRERIEDENKDPLLEFCEVYPESDECREYDC